MSSIGRAIVSVVKLDLPGWWDYKAILSVLCFGQIYWPSSRSQMPSQRDGPVLVVQPLALEMKCA